VGVYRWKSPWNIASVNYPHTRGGIVVENVTPLLTSFITPVTAPLVFK
jgi:hypothetical protein